MGGLLMAAAMAGSGSILLHVREGAQRQLFGQMVRIAVPPEVDPWMLEKVPRGTFWILY